MVLCLIALPVFAILGIFSLRYRKLTKDALHCLFRTATLRKCESDLDDRIRSNISGHLLRYSPRTGAFFYKHYRLISFLILALFIWSAYAGGVGIYNYALYGNCNGPQSTGFCPLDPYGQNSKISKASEIDISAGISCPSVEKGEPMIGNPNATLTIIEFGCYACPYTKKAEPIIGEVLDYYNGTVNLQFRSFDISGHPIGHPAALAADCALEQGKYLEYHIKLFEMQENLSNSTLYDIANITGLDMEKFSLCMSNETYKSELEQDTLAGMKAGVQGTPTFFINTQQIVGPKPFKTFKKIIDEELRS